MYNAECCILGSLDPQFVLHTKRVAGMFTQFWRYFEGKGVYTI